MENKKYVYTKDGLELTLNIELTDGLITNWNMFGYINDVRIKDSSIDDESYANLNNISDFIHKFTELDDFEYINLYNYSHNHTAIGIIYKPTNQIIGYDGVFSSWDDLEYTNKLIADVVLTKSMKGKKYV